MAQTKEGAIKIAAKKTGVSVGQYRTNINNGLLWCTGCKMWHKKDVFNSDKSRWTGKTQSCRIYKKIEYKKLHKPIPPEQRKRMGPSPFAEREGDKKQARRRINVLVRTGKIPHPNNLICSDCGHVHKAGGKRHEYDHYEGYSTGKHLVVRALCSTCHHKKHPMDYSQRKTVNNSKPQIGEKNGSSKITETSVIAIRNLRKNSGYSFSKLAAIFEISNSQVANIVHRRAWRHI